MARRTFEMSFKIGGSLASSFSSTFTGASNRLSVLTNEARQTQRALDQLGNDFRNGRITQEQFEDSTRRLTGELTDLNRQLTRMKNLESGIKNFGASLDRGLNTVKNVAGMAALGTAAVTTGLAFDSLNKAATFEQQMTKVGVISSATAAEMKKLNDTALELGANTSLSASEVALGMTELSTKGYNATTIMSAMPGMIAAAEASGEDLALTSNVVASALNAFNLAGEKSSEVADIMAMTANKTAAGVEDLGYAFKYAAPWANSLGISMEELAAATGMMVDKGLAGEQAGTSLRMGLNRLAQEPKKAEKALNKLGVSAFDANGDFTSMNQLIVDLRKSLKGLSQQEKIQNIGAIFGVEASSGWLTLIDSAPERLQSLTQALEESEGSAKKAADAMKDNYMGALEQLSGSVESAQIKFMTPVLPVFQDLFTGLTSLIDENMGGIEKAGEKFAGGLKDIFEPFSIQKPEFDATNRDPEYIAQYNKQLAQFTKFNGMDFGDKVVYMLDEGTAKAETWLSGPGGDSMEKIFTKLGEIAAKAWWNAFTGVVKSSASNLAEGNVAAGLGMGAAAWALGGGVIAKGAIGAGKMAKGAISSRRNATNPPPTPPITDPSNNQRRTRSNRNNPPPDTTRRRSTRSGSNNGGLKSFGSKALKVAGKAALPVAAGLTVVDIVRSDDKAKATAEGVGGLAASLGGAKIGAAIGTAIAPGIGTAIGGLIGGVGGFVAGKWLGGKAVDTAREKGSTAKATTQSATQTASSVSTTGLQSAVSLSEQNFRSLAINTAQAVVGVVVGFNGIKSAATITTTNLNALNMWTGQASGWVVGSFNGIKTSADMVKNNLDILVSYTAQASGWLASLNTIQTAGQRVEQALNNLANRIDNVQMPNVGANKRVSYDG